MLNRIESKKSIRFGKSNRFRIFFSELECCSPYLCGTKSLAYCELALFVAVLGTWCHTDVSSRNYPRLAVSWQLASRKYSVHTEGPASQSPCQLLWGRRNIVSSLMLHRRHQHHRTPAVNRTLHGCNPLSQWKSSTNTKTLGKAKDKDLYVKNKKLPFVLQ